MSKVSATAFATLAPFSAPALYTPGGGQRGIFAERMAGDEFGVAGEAEPCFGFENADDGERHGHQRRLRVLRQRQRVLRALEDRLAQFFAERLVDFGEDLPRRREGVGERLAHADRLAALPGKYECDRHACPLRFMIDGHDP